MGAVNIYRPCILWWHMSVCVDLVFQPCLCSFMIICSHDSPATTSICESVNNYYFVCVSKNNYQSCYIAYEHKEQSVQYLPAQNNVHQLKQEPCLGLLLPQSLHHIITTSQFSRSSTAKGKILDHFIRQK